MKYFRPRFIAVLLLAVYLIGCVPEKALEGFRPDGSGQIYIYVHSKRTTPVDLAFSVKGVQFLNERGEWIAVPLEERLDSRLIRGKQKRLAELYLPQGKYRQMKWKIAEPSRHDTGRSDALTVGGSKGEVPLDIEFSVFRGESQAFFIQWEVDGSLLEGSVFYPKMTIKPQGMEIRKILLYVTNSGSDSISVVDRQRDRVVATVGVGKEPKGIVANGDGTRIYVANYGSKNISVIHGGTNRVVNTIRNFGYGPVELALSADGDWLYAVNSDTDNVSVISTASYTVTNHIRVGRRPLGIQYDQARSNIYVANHGENTVSVVDQTALKVAQTITVGIGPVGLAMKQDDLYVANSGSNNVSVIQLGPFTEKKTVAVGITPWRILSGLGDWLYVANRNSNDVSFLYTSLGMANKTISVGDMPSHMALDSVRRKVYVINERSNTVSVIDLATKRVRTTIDVGYKPYGIVAIEE